MIEEESQVTHGPNSPWDWNICRPPQKKTNQKSKHIQYMHHQEVLDEGSMPTLWVCWRDPDKRTEPHERRKTKRKERKETITNEMGTKGGWGKATQRNQPKEEDLCHTSARP